MTEGSIIPHKLSKRERRREVKLEKCIAENYNRQERAIEDLGTAFPSEPLEFNNDTRVRELICSVRNFVPGDEQEQAICRGLVRELTEKSDINLTKLVMETDKDTELRNIRQAIVDKRYDLLPVEFRKKKDWLSTELGVVFMDSKIVIPVTLKEWVLQVIHGDHEGVPKMRLLAERVWWATKDKDIKEKAKNCITCFRSGKSLKTVLPESETNKLQEFSEIGEEIQFDFVGPLYNETGQKRYIVVAIDQFSKWPFAKVTKSCNAKSVIKLLTEISENIGLRKAIKSDNGKAFVAKSLRKLLKEKGIQRKFCTPYVHTPIGRLIQSLQNYIRTFLLEGNDLKFATRRAVKSARFTFHSSINSTPFEKLTGRKQRNLFDNLFNLDYPGKTLINVVKDANGKLITSEAMNPFEIEEFEDNRSWGKSRELTELRKEVNKQSRQKRAPKVRKYFVEKTRNRSGWDSKFQQVPKVVDSESKHTVKSGNRVLHKKDIAFVPEEVANEIFQRAASKQPKTRKEKKSSRAMPLGNSPHKLTQMQTKERTSRRYQTRNGSLDKRC